MCRACSALQPIAIGPDATAGTGLGVAKFFDWYHATLSGGCVNGSNGHCVGHTPQGDTYYFTAWLPNASGLPATTGLPVVGTINDYNMASICSGNIGGATRRDAGGDIVLPIIGDHT